MKKTFIIVMILVAGATSTYALNPVDYEVNHTYNDHSYYAG